ncbi:hypothetical protein HN748_00935 [Candidatus Peregrinibacteria bacterium]|jgi:hypothetical protein|nr:hypothetical protein [Candidatus Peregrinibacteria bacterium]MBT7483506.1 hypothetical protein [Candidatus Peregrinibacteria bacterium]MBT7702776.1 hypothetical protein [Candidatus Peregrinibacteria bacterium]
MADPNSKNDNPGSNLLKVVHTASQVDQQNKENVEGMQDANGEWVKFNEKSS